MVAYQGQTRRATRRAGDEGVESNSRLTAGTAAVLLVLFAVEGISLLGIRSHLGIHIFVGMMLIPPVLLKMGSTTYRFAKYYTGWPAYKRKGPPPVTLRLLGPFIVALTVILLASGVGLIIAPHGLGNRMLTLHQASFVLWFIAMAVHVLGHILETAENAPLDWARRTRRRVAGASLRQWAIVSSLGLGILLGIVTLGTATPYLNSTGGLFFHHIHH